MKCCFASSREKTVTLAGLPNSPAIRRRMKTCPNEPVPPVTRTRLPSRDRIPIQPFIVGCWIVSQLLDEIRQRWALVTGCSLEAAAIQASIAVKARIRVDGHAHLIRIPQQQQKIVLRDRAA